MFKKKKKIYWQSLYEEHNTGSAAYNPPLIGPEVGIFLCGKYMLISSVALPPSEQPIKDQINSKISASDMKHNRRADVINNKKKIKYLWRTYYSTLRKPILSLVIIFEIGASRGCLWLLVRWFVVDMSDVNKPN